MIGSLNMLGQYAANYPRQIAPNPTAAPPATIVATKVATSPIETIQIDTTNRNMAIGNNAAYFGAQSTAVGDGAVCSVGSFGSAFGAGATVVNQDGSAFGRGANAAILAEAFGSQSNASASGAIAIGFASVASAGDAIAIGDTASASAANSIALGNNAHATVAGDINLGNQVTSVAGSSLNLRTVNTVVAAAAGASDAYLLVSVNGVQYKLLLHT